MSKIFHTGECEEPGCEFQKAAHYPVCPTHRLIQIDLKEVWE